MDEVRLKEAFVKIKQDMDYLQLEMTQIKSEIFQMKNLFRASPNSTPLKKLPEIPPQSSVFIKEGSKTIPTHNPTHSDNPTHNPTLPQETEGLKYSNLNTSTGNRGVPTDRQTDRPTDGLIEIAPNLDRNNPQSHENLSNYSSRNTLDKDIDNASLILDSLDNLKREIRKKFKKITNQEMRVFSSIYQLEEQDPESVTYKNIAEKLNLSQSSIRDYVQRMCAKGIPINKEKVNNKQLILSISPNLKKIASLATILQLREL